MAIKDKEKYNEYMRNYLRERWLKRRATAIMVLGGRCVECLSTEDLEFDHIDPAEKSFTIAKASTWSDTRFWAELEKCQLLCKNCHADKTSQYLKILFKGRIPGNKIFKPNHGTAKMYNVKKM